jgi:hypothetical protein
VGFGSTSLFGRQPLRSDLNADLRRGNDFLRAAFARFERAVHVTDPDGCMLAAEVHTSFSLARRRPDPMELIGPWRGGRAELPRIFAPYFGPPNTGTIVAAQWDFEGDGDYPVTAQPPATKTSDGAITLKTTHAFSKPGTYFPVVRAMSQREGDARTPHTQVHNLGPSPGDRSLIYGAPQDRWTGTVWDHKGGTAVPSGNNLPSNDGYAAGRPSFAR